MGCWGGVIMKLLYPSFLSFRIILICWSLGSRAFVPAIFGNDIGNDRANQSLSERFGQELQINTSVSLTHKHQPSLLFVSSPPSIR
ncbi:hypothetical protein QVD17_22303 [Tagetes erecta]|uniref:Uncharacterized protein n=1 Tax=Tagetes erecta TaxID=13708 RepID=A0AAD8NTJ5_TARER|nr:hypothetical protein QVD17_22303 [Tagetes erecta]